MRVLHVLSSVIFSGAENVACQIILGFKCDSSVKMAYCSPFSENVEQALTTRNVAYYPVKSLSVHNLRKIIQEFKPDVIHSHDMRASFVTYLSCGKIPFISHIHNNAFDSRKITFKSLAYYFTAKKAKHIIWVSNSSYSGYRFGKKFKNKSTVLYNVISLEDLYSRMNQDPTKYDYDVVYIGRITYQKNPERLINICSLLKTANKNINIAIVGSGDQEDYVKKEISKRHLNDCVDYLGYMNNPLKLLHDAKVMLLTSRWEGTPMVALESLALGTPVISTPVDGLKDIIENNKNGFLSDDDDEIVDTILKYCGSNDLLLSMSSKMTEDFKIKNDMAKYCLALENIYKKALTK